MTKGKLAWLLAGAVVSGGAAPPASHPRLVEEKADLAPGESEIKAAVRLAARIEPELARLAARGGQPLATGREQIGAMGNHLMLAVIGPEQGAFAYVPLAAMRGGNVPICRFEVRWPAAAAARSAAGLHWAFRSFPDVNCRAQPADLDAGWESTSGELRRSVTARGVGATVISTDDIARPPADLRAAIRLAVPAGNRLNRIVPLPTLRPQRAAAWTREGKLLLAVEGDNPLDVCVVQVDKPEALAPHSSEQRAAEQRCRPLFEEVRKARSARLQRAYENNPPILKPL